MGHRVFINWRSSIYLKVLYFFQPKSEEVRGRLSFLFLVFAIFRSYHFFPFFISNPDIMCAFKLVLINWEKCLAQGNNWTAWDGRRGGTWFGWTQDRPTILKYNPSALNTKYILVLARVSCGLRIGSLHSQCVDPVANLQFWDQRKSPFLDCSLRKHFFLEILRTSPKKTT